jgi:hypothetical protein
MSIQVDSEVRVKATGESFFAVAFDKKAQLWAVARTFRGPVIAHHMSSDLEVRAPSPLGFKF